MEMEQKEEVKQIGEEQQNPEDKPNKNNESHKLEAEKEELHNFSGNHNEKTIPMLEHNQFPDGMKAKRCENVSEIAAATGREEENRRSYSNSSRKPNQGSRPNCLKSKLVVTVPQPFTLATDRRIMSRERRSSVDFPSATDKKITKERKGSVDFKELQPRLSKCSSFSYKTHSCGLGESNSSKPRLATSATASIKTSSKTHITNAERSEKNVENGLRTTKHKLQIKEVESKCLQVTSKKQQEKELDKNKIRKSPTFKASPLPSFYHRKVSRTMLEINKIPPTRPKSPVLGQKSKSIANSEKLKLEEKGKRSTSGTVSNSAKKAINEFLQNTKRPLNGSKATEKGVDSSA